MNLQEHMDVLGHNVNALAFRSKVDSELIERALAGKPIPESDARKLKSYIGGRMGHDPRGADPHSEQEYQIDGLATIAAPKGGRR
ncbi:MAG TPA: hypothetical protein VH593_16830 [Ktedonobacteraceae bacterium]|jgi:hypothetical protein